MHLCVKTFNILLNWLKRSTIPQINQSLIRRINNFFARKTLMTSHSSRSKSILPQKDNLWIDSENEEKNILLNDADSSSSSSSEDASQSSCCLICSILPNLSNINTCEKHLAILTQPRMAKQVVYMMHPSINHCPCQRKSKHRCRSISSSSSESEYRHQRKKRSMTVQSSNTSSQDDQFFSPCIQSQENPKYHIEARLSPSLPPSSIIHTNKHYPELLLTPFLPRTSTEIEPSIEETSLDIIEIDPPSTSSLRISPNRIVHVKDEDEPLNDTNPMTTMINMAEATEQMFNHEYPQPIIFLKRISLDHCK